jgi:Spy/CpxP family protein refolding chaperone
MYLKLTIIVGFLVAFAAGIMVGRRTTPTVVTPMAPQTTQPSGPRRGPGFLTAELGLTPEQQAKAKEIWSNMSGRRERDDDRRRQFRKERDDAVIALLSPEQKAKYDAVYKNYDEKNNALEREGRELFLENVKRMKLILTSEQLAKYEAILAKMEADRASRGDRRGPGGPPPASAPSNETTQPATVP